MYFINTRNNNKVSSAEAILYGVAENGGLYVPENFPKLSKETLAKLSELTYSERVAEILSMFFDVDKSVLLEICEGVYSTFEGQDPVPMVKIDEDKFMLELYHGSTCSYVDLSVGLYPKIFEECKKALGVKKKLLIVNATTGDDGKATMEAFKNDKNAKVAVFYPDETVVKMQRLQMGIQKGDNVSSFAVKGYYDDTKRGVDKVFTAETKKEIEKEGYVLTTTTSENIFTVICEVAYFVSAYIDLVFNGQIEENEPVDFVMPAGNADNVIACYYAKKMGVPVRKIVSASNRNRSTSDFFNKGEINLSRAFARTMSPALDMNKGDNIERFVFEITGRNAELCKKVMEEGDTLSVSGVEKNETRKEITAMHMSEDEIVDGMYEIFDEYGYAMDTVTGVALAASIKISEKKEVKDETKIVVLSVGNAYKYPQDVLYALSGNDVKDAFKGVKRLYLLTAMQAPKALTDLRYKTPRFKKTVAVNKVKDEVIAVLKGEIAPEVNE